MCSFRLTKETLKELLWDVAPGTIPNSETDLIDPRGGKDYVVTTGVVRL